MRATSRTCSPTASTGGTWTGGGPAADTAADGAMLDWSPRRDADVVAWRAICTGISSYRGRECWRGPVWTRVATEAEHDPARHRIYSADAILAQDLEDLIMEDWDRHIAP